jgi:hypothetical protein
MKVFGKMPNTARKMRALYLWAYRYLNYFLVYRNQQVFD